MQPATGWSVAAVPALISFDRFFALLANRQFPVATFIRRRDELDYLQEPDIFHEIFGHCAMLTNPAFAHFTHLYGQLGLQASKDQRVFLARLYWFTVEFGLLATPDGLRIYGGGILSSIGETAYALSGQPLLQPFDLLTVLRTLSHRHHAAHLFCAAESRSSLPTDREEIMAALAEASRLGLYPPRFEVPAGKQAS